MPALAVTQAELLAVDAGRTELDDRSGQRLEDRRHLAVRLGDHGGDADVAPLSEGAHQGHLGQEGHTQLVGQLGASAGPEQLVALPVVAGEPAHVLDNPPYGQLQLAGGVGRALGHPLGGGLRRGDHVDLGLGEVLAEGEGDVTGAGGHVDQQVVGLAPVGVDQELLERLVQHRAAPDHRSVVGDEVPHGQAADTVGRRRHHQVADDQRVVGYPEHRRDREPVDVGVEDPDVEPRPGQGHGQVDGDRGLAHTALARRDAEDPGLRAGQHEPVGSALLVAEATTAVVVVVPWPCPWPSSGACWVPPSTASPRSSIRSRARGSSSMTAVVTVTSSTPGTARTAGPDPLVQLVDLGVVGHRQGHLDRHPLAPGLDAPDHAQLPQRPTQLGVGHRGHGRRDLGLVDGHPAAPRGIRPPR